MYIESCFLASSNSRVMCGQTVVFEGPYFRCIIVMHHIEHQVVWC